MNEEELLRRAQEMQRQGVPPALIAQYLESQRSPGARFADPTVPAKTDTGEEILPAAPRKTSGFEKRLAAGETLVSGLTSGANDELTGAVQAVGAALPGGRSPGQAYTFFRDASRARKADLARSNPGVATLLEMAGGLPTIAATGGAALAGKAPMLAQMARGAGAGAAMGAVSGAGHADEGNKLTGIVFGGGLGALAGGLIPPVATGIQNAARNTGVTNILQRVPGVNMLPGMKRRADDALIRAASREGTSLPGVLNRPVTPATIAATAVPDEAKTVLPVAMKHDPRLKKIANSRIKSAEKEVKAVGNQIDEMLAPVPHYSPEVQAVDVDAFLAGAPKPVQKLWRQVQAEVKDRGRALPEQTIQVPFSGTFEEALKTLKLPPQLAAQIATGRLRGPVPAQVAQQLGLMVDEVVPIPTLESLVLLKRKLQGEGQALAKAGGAKATRGPPLWEAHDQLAEILRKPGVAPKYMELNDAYAAAEDNLAKIINVTGAKKAPGVGAPKYRVQRVSDMGGQPHYADVRAPSDVVRGNFGGALGNFLTGVLRSNTLSERGRVAAELGTKLLQPGRRGQRSLIDIANRSLNVGGRRFGQAQRAGVVSGQGAGLLAGFLPEDPDAPPQ